MQNLNVALIQTSIFWESPKANIEMLGCKIDNLVEDIDLIVLPEMFSTGFTMNPYNLAHNMKGKIVKWLVRKSREKSTDIVGSLIIKENEKYYNRLVWIKADGNVEFYDKKHLFSYAGEDKAYSPGEKRIIIECRGWRICPFICYDLRFPLWNRNVLNSYDAALFVANWPEVRTNNWKALLIARAIENQCYVVGVNRVGTDGNGIKYVGDSMVINPYGDTVAHAILEETIIISSLSYKILDDLRYELPFWKDADVNLIPKI